MSNLNLQSAKAELIRAANHLNATGVLFKGEHANLSARLTDGNIVITRGGNIGNLNEDSFAVVTLQGATVQGQIDPTTAEIVEMHTAVYRVRDSIGCIIHCHAPYATVFAIAHQPIPVVYEPLMRFGITEPIPVVPWAPRGSEASVGGIVNLVKEHPNTAAVLLANHGILGFASDPAQTSQMLATIDEAAQLVLQSQAIGGPKELPEEAFERVRARMQQFASPVTV